MSVHEKVMGAVARGWCAPVNSRKEMDANLAMAIVTEVEKLLSGPDLCAACEAYLRENGWVENEHRSGRWRQVDGDPWLWTGEALDVQWARDGIGGAT